MATTEDFLYGPEQRFMRNTEKIKNVEIGTETIQ